ncbi:hypothetical protein BCR36DRAFT_408797 [Piromyces finnis]|uniref:FERM domain-containing protein n=1 Tax=Piromyces finnis TaxID=1754191 RepID=A0A1Y1VN20_9FUNG|nr:hypothetical protein BCR36DRAFT_408797 [Piromyces finnis]|eukprot:ORX59304.1 hypothetical protein BCR36DRAFT_408797 [Piromyces finnis]
MSQISVKVVIIDMNITKTISLVGSMTVQEVCRDIREKNGEVAGGIDHSLFWPDNKKWLALGRTLDFYDIKTGDTLEFKKKHRILKVRMMDDSIKTFLIDESLPVKSIVEYVGQKLGISNIEEYSFAPGVEPSSPLPKDKKKEKKKEDVQWLNPAKSLIEQGMGENDVVIFKKKFFFSDQNIDRNDPIQLNLLYNQVRELIILGKYPCTMEEAAQLAAIQCQIQYGNYDSEKHKDKFFRNPEIVPKEYFKNRSVEKMIQQEYSKLKGLNELNAKFRYVQLSRSLKTYGVSFFYVMEKGEKKSKYNIPVYLGVTKESVIKLDVETKEIKKKWSLKQLRRWAATPTSFTLDFGDYSNAYYNVQTKEGEQISQLISGYIDIILKKKKDAERMSKEEDEEYAVTEEYNVGGKAKALTNGGGAVKNYAQANRVNGNAMKMKMYGKGMLSVNQPRFNSTNTSVSPEVYGAQQGIIQNINNGFATIQSILDDMVNINEIPELSNDASALQWKKQTLDVNTENIRSQVASDISASCSILNHTNCDMEEMEYDVIGGDITTLSANIIQLVPSAKMVSTLVDDEDKKNKILDCAKELADATARFLGSVQPVILGQGNKEEMYQCADEIGKTAYSLLKELGIIEIDDDKIRDLLEAAREISNATTDLTLAANSVSNAFPSSDKKHELLKNAKMCTACAVSLISATTVSAPGITSTVVFDEFMDSCALMKDTVTEIQNSSLGCTDENALNGLNHAAQNVSECIAKLINLAKLISDDYDGATEFDKGYDAVIASLDQYMDSLGDIEAMVECTRDCTYCTRQYINILKNMADNEENDDNKSRLYDAIKGLTDATTKMILSAKDLTKDPDDYEKQMNLRRILDEINDIMMSSSDSDSLRTRAFQKLAKAAREVISSCNQLTSAGNMAAPSNRNQASQISLNQAGRRVGEIAPNSITAIRDYLNDRENTQKQLALLNSSKQLVTPCKNMCACAKTAAATTGDASAQTQLLLGAKHTAEDLRQLQLALECVEEVSAGLELEMAIAMVKQLEEDICHVKENRGELVPRVGQTIDMAQIELSSSVKPLSNAITQLCNSASQGAEKYTSNAARDLANYLQAVEVCCKNLSAINESELAQDEILNACENVLGEATVYLNASSEALNSVEAREKMSEYARRMNEAVAELLMVLPGLKELENAIKNISNALSNLANSYTPNGDISYRDAQMNLSTDASSLVVASNNLVSAAKSNPTELYNAACKFNDTFEKISLGAQDFISTCEDKAIKGKIVDLLNELGESSQELLNATKMYSLNTADQDLKDKLFAATKSISDSISKILDTCSADAPGHSECNQASQILNEASAKIETVNDNNDCNLSYPESMSLVTNKSKTVTSSITNLTAASRGGNIKKIGQVVVELAEAIKEITDGNIQAAYLIGIADPSSVAATSRVINQNQFIEGVNEIKSSCKILTQEDCSNEAIMEAASIIAKYTAALCNTSKEAGKKSNISYNSKTKFLNSAREIATYTAALVKSIKELSANNNDETRKNCEEKSNHLIETIEDLVAFSMSPEFAGSPAYISPIGEANQKPLITYNHSLINSALGLVSALKVVCNNPKDNSAIQVVQSQGRQINEALRNLIATLSTSAPGIKECDQAIERITDLLSELDSALVETAAGKLKPKDVNVDAHNVQNSLLDVMRALSSLFEVIGRSAKDNSSELASSVAQLSGNMTQGVNSAIDIAAKTSDRSNSGKMLEDIKDINEMLLSFLYSCKDSGGDPSNTEAHERIDADYDALNKLMKDFITSLEGSSADDEDYSKNVKKIEDQLANLSNHDTGEINEQYQVYASNVDEKGKEILQKIAEILQGNDTNSDETKAYAAALADIYETIVENGKNAISTTTEENIKQSIEDDLRELGGSIIKTIEAMKINRANSNQNTKVRLNIASKDVINNTSNLIKDAKEGSRGLTVCQTAIETIGEVCTDLEAAIIFASAGQLDPIDTKDNFSLHREDLLKEAKNLTDITKAFVMAAATSNTNQEAFAQNALNASKTSISLKNEVKKGAISITSGDKHMQEQLLEADKNVSEALSNLIAEAMKTFGKNLTGGDALALKNAAAEEVKALIELIRITKMVGNETTRGVRALDGACADIDGGIIVLESDTPAIGTALPDEVVMLAKCVASAAGALFTTFSSGKQDELVAAANKIKTSVCDMLRAGKAAISNAPEDKKDPMIKALKESANASKDLLSCTKDNLEKENGDNKAAIIECSKSIAAAVNNVVTAAGDLIPGGYVDPNDPNVIAERELLSAANAIEAAAKKLATLKPVERPQEANENLNFEEQILEAVKAIAAATSALVRAATNTQREIIAMGKLLPQEDQVYFSDGTWSEGLVSAAKQVCAWTHELCESANMAIKGNVQPERVIAASRNVAASTTHLLSAATAKVDQNSQTQIRLRAAARAVTQATEQLVKSAQENMALEDTDAFTESLKDGVANSRAQELEAQMNILKMEKDLEKARNKLLYIRKGRYQKQNGGGGGTISKRGTGMLSGK